MTESRKTIDLCDATAHAAAGRIHSIAGKIWGNKFLTKGGPFHHQLEQALCDYLGAKYISLFANGTLALDYLPASADSCGPMLRFDAALVTSATPFSARAAAAAAI